MPWYRVTFSKPDLAARQSEILQDDFRVLIVAAGAPLNAAMFDHKDGVSFYFSPEGVRLALPLIERYGGVPCSAPAEEDVRLFAGDANNRVFDSKSR
jgi:hypothetical protein